MTKTKYRDKLYAEAYLRFQLFPIIPDLKFMCLSKQFHPSHWEIHIQLFVLFYRFIILNSKVFALSYIPANKKMSKNNLPILPTEKQGWVLWNIWAWKRVLQTEKFEKHWSNTCILKYFFFITNLCITHVSNAGNWCRKKLWLDWHLFCKLSVILGTKGGAKSSKLPVLKGSAGRLSVSQFWFLQYITLCFALSVNWMF